MHDNTNMTRNKMTSLRVEKYVWHEIISKLFLFVKVKFKVTLSRGSHFKVHFSLKLRENRGSSQNLHGVPFSRDREIITPSHTIILLLVHTTHI